MGKHARMSDSVKAAYQTTDDYEVRARTHEVYSMAEGSWQEWLVAQVLHVGPYDTVGESYRALGEYAEAHGLRCKVPGHEVYVSDPRRVPPDRLKTIVRMPVARGRR